jgi:hypothetical protein
MSLRRRDVARTGPERPPGRAGEQSPEPARLRRLLEVVILGALAPGDTTRLAYIRNRWRGHERPETKRACPRVD